MTRVLIVDDHPVMLQGCRRVFEDAGIESILAASDIVSAYRIYRRHRPEIVIVDLALQGNGLAGLRLIQRIRVHDPRAGIVVFSMHSDPVIVSQALQAGATAYVLKDTSPDHLIEAFDAVRGGRPYLSNELAARVALSRAGASSDPRRDLTARELQTLGLLAEGKSYGRIAEDLCVSYKTVVNTCSQLKHKLNARSLPDLIRMAVQLMAPGPPGLRKVQ
jgi:DNA-binding NarL/FixJ family response regulator